MKLLHCLKCQDVVKLDYDWRVCKCKESAGYYLPDGINARYGGEHAVLLGFSNCSILPAIIASQEKPKEDGSGWRIEAFVIPEDAPTVERVEYRPVG